MTTHGSAEQALKVKQSAAATATVQLDQDGNATTFHVHGGGPVISRVVNESGIAKKIASTIEEAFRQDASRRMTGMVGGRDHNGWSGGAVTVTTPGGPSGVGTADRPPAHRYAGEPCFQQAIASHAGLITGGNSTA